MNRRDFIRGSGEFLAATACSGLLVSCSEFVQEIPCLGPAAAPSPVPGTTYIWASRIGCALDCNLANGRNKHTGGLATDDGPRINAAMAGASATNPITLIIDGSALISGLFLPAGGYWSIAGLGCGTGFFVKSGTNNDGIHNGGPSATIPYSPGAPPARGSNVSLQNFTINGDQGNGRNGDSTAGSTQGVTSGSSPRWYFAINLMNLNNIDVENVVVVNSPSFQMLFSNVGNVKISGCVLRSTGPNTDGLHFDGPANDITISNCDITSGDDSIALNCPEGYTGNISRVSIENCKVNSGSFLVRFHPIADSNGPKFNIDTVTVSNCSGTCAFAGFLVGHGAGANPEAITGVTISDCSISAPSILEIGANFGIVSLVRVTLVTSASPQLPGFALARSSAYSGGCSYTGRSLNVKDCTVQPKHGASVPVFDLENGSTMGTLIVDGYSLVAGDAKVPSLVNVVSGEIGQLVIDSADSSHIGGPISSGGFLDIGSISGTGVLATGWQFPDSVMADNVPYISATTGLPSIKVDGVVEPYSP